MITVCTDNTSTKYLLEASKVQLNLLSLLALLPRSLELGFSDLMKHT